MKATVKNDTTWHNRIDERNTDIYNIDKMKMTKSELADMMNSFVSDDDEKWLMFNAKMKNEDK